MLCVLSLTLSLLLLMLLMLLLLLMLRQVPPGVPVSILWGADDPWEDMREGRRLFGHYPCVTGAWCVLGCGVWDGECAGERGLGGCCSAAYRTRAASAAATDAAGIDRRLMCVMCVV